MRALLAPTAMRNVITESDGRGDFDQPLVRPCCRGAGQRDPSGERIATLESEYELYL